MKYIINIFVLVILLIFAGKTYAQNHASATATVSVTIVKPLNIQQTANLNFGDISNNSGVVNVSSRNKEAGGFSIEGKPGAQINVILPQDVILQSSNGHKLKVISRDHAYNTINNQQESIEMNSQSDRDISLNKKNGTLFVWFGGRINSNGAKKGTYTGSYTATVAYLDQ